MKKMIIAVAVIAIAAAMCIPACVFADNSDAACTKTNGSAGISAKLSTSDEKEIVKFFPKDAWNDIATSIWMSQFDGLIATPSPMVYDISEGKIEEVEKYAVSHGMEITDDYVSEVNSESQIMKYSFKATCKTSDLSFINTDLGQLIKYIDPTNNTHKDSVLKVTVTIENTTSDVTKKYITKNSENNFVVTEVTGERLDYSRVYAEVKYSYGTTEKEFTYEQVNDEFVKGTTKMDFMNVEPKDATASTKVLGSMDYDDIQYVVKTVIKCDGKTYTNKQDLGASVIGTTEISKYGALGPSMVLTGDLSVPTYKFYGDVLDDYALFNEASVADESLRSNDAMKNYIKENGSIGEDFSAAKSTAEAPMPSSGGPNILLFVAIGIGAVVIIAVVAFIFLKKK